MSEEILKALMQLFAIIAKQDEGLGDSEREYVEVFLKQQISAEAVADYLALFDGYVNDDKGGGSKLTSVRDSVRILGICKKINKTLTQKQKVVVLVRLFELVSAEGKFSEQRMAIINTVSEVFKVEPEEFADIEAFVLSKELTTLQRSTILLIHAEKHEVEHKEEELSKEICVESLDRPIAILRIRSEDLYFLSYVGS